MKILLFAALFVLAACSSNDQRAQVYQKEGAAISGYDPVAFFSEQKPVKGSAQYTTEWNGAQWRFASKAHLDSFVTAPAKYAPQYGGYCAYGTADGHKATTEVDTWTIIDGKLYFNYNKEVKQLWNKQIPEYIQQADANWPQVKNSKL